MKSGNFFSVAIGILTMVCACASGPEGAAYREIPVKIDAGNYLIPAVLTLPGGNGKFPAVVMLHGFGSNKDEAGNAYLTFAPELAQYGIASIRIDFMGYGESAVDHAGFDLNVGVMEARKAADYLAELPGIDAGRIGIMGWSKGGAIALLTAGRDSRFKSVLTWAGAPHLGGVYSEAAYAQAKQDGVYVAEPGWREPFNLSLKAFEVNAATNILSEFANCAAPVFAINGSADTSVPPATADDIKNTSANKASKSLIITGADHTFNIFTEDKTAFNILSQESIRWFTETL